MKLYGEEHRDVVVESFNYANDLFDLRRFEEAKSLLLRQIPVAQRVLGNDNENTLKMRTIYALTLFKDDGATRDDLSEAVNTLEDTTSTARRVLGGAYPLTSAIENALREAQAALRARETPPSST